MTKEKVDFTKWWNPHAPRTNAAAPEAPPVYGVRTYRKKPVEVKALQWTGANFVNMETFLESPRNGWFHREFLYLHMGENEVRCRPGTWVVRGATGGYHPVPEHAFGQVYELAETFHHPV